MPSTLPPQQRILIVDDQRPVADTLAQVFELNGYNSWAFYSAESALAITGWSPHLAIVDVDLPGMNGLDLALRLRELYPDCHILLFSGHGNTSALLDQVTRDGHTFRVYSKPLPPATLLALVADQLSPAQHA